MKRLLLAACIVSLTACGGGKDDVKSGYEDKIRASGQSLVYSFPLADQVEVPTPSPVVLRFTSAVTDPATANVRLLDANGQPVAASMTSVDGDRGLILTPDTPLNPLAHYTIDIPELALADGKSAARSLHFTTRGLHQGPAASVGADTFDVLRRFPDGQTLPVADLSSLRLQLSQPLDRNTVKYGDAADSTISLVDANGQLVPARVLVGDSYLTIDPVNDMVGGAQYTLKIATGSAGLKSSRGLTLPATGMGANAWSWSFTPEDTRPPASTKNPNRDRARMVQIIDDTPMDSPLTGKRVNLVPMYSVLLGTESSAHPATPQASGYLAAELAHIPEHDETTPLRIDRGSLIKASSLPIYIGGEVPAGFDSGQVYMEFLSDATGYLIENPYSTNPEAPKLVRLMMDMGISAEGDIANGSVTQTLMHIELVGTALVEDGLMTLNAVGVVQPNILGTERATAVLSFYMQGLDDQVNAPVPPVDESAMSLKSLTVGWDNLQQLDKTALLKGNESIVLNFSRPIDPQSISGLVSLTKEQSGVVTDVPLDIHVDGAALVIKPEEPLELQAELGSPFNYRLKVSGGVRGILGEEWSGQLDEIIEMPTRVEQRQEYSINAQGLVIPKGNVQSTLKKSPFVLGLYPGFPCVVDNASANLQQNIQGRCKGGIHPHTVPVGKEDFALEPDDLIPVAEMPSNRPIVIITSSEVDHDTVVLGKTLLVTRVDDSGADIGEVEGDVTVDGDTIRFHPKKPWVAGELYSYALVSNGDASSNIAQCDPSLTGLNICSLDGLPLNTQLLTESKVEYEATSAFYNKNYGTPQWISETKMVLMDGGGEKLRQIFRGVEESKYPLQLLRLTQTWDVNRNLELERNLTDMGPIPKIGLSRLGFNHIFTYGAQEGDGYVFESDPSTGSLEDIFERGILLDPQGVKGPPNTAKVLSSQFGITSIEEGQDRFNRPGEGVIWPANGITAAYVGANIGCGFESFSEWSPVLGDGCEKFSNPATGGYGSMKPGVPLSFACFKAEPKVCPEDKFTHIHGVLFAEVGEHSGSEVPVRVYPGHMVTTSFKVYTKNMTQEAQDTIDSGYQVMRMRYSQGKPVPGKIVSGFGGPEMVVPEIGLYLDAPQMVDQVARVKQLASNRNYAFHNLYSYPLKMKLKGDIDFLEDGRMIVQQTNEGKVEIEMRGNSPIVWVDLMIPSGGINIVYVSEEIK